jgi:4-hydroxy-tetrahydrodipicolinate reductase
LTDGAAARDKRGAAFRPGENPLSAPIRIAIAGALGRMGQAIAAAVAARDDLVVTARFDRPDAAGEGLVSQDEALGLCDVVIDFTMPEASVALAQACAARGGPALVVGATGISDAQIALLKAAASKLAMVQTGNFSLGVNMLVGLVNQASKALGPDAYDIEVFEAHHKHKVDAPSGTALMLGRAAAEGRGVDLDKVGVRARDGITGPRRSGDIGFSVMRGGGIIGEHSVSFVADDEIVTISHSARDRSLFARGAVEAARWVAGRPAGHYDMQDVLGMKG